MYKLVSMDLDDTLLTTEKVMSSLFKSFVEELKKNNIIPIIATGREYTTAKKFVGDVDIDLICNNGNLIKNSKNNEVIYINPIPKSDVEEIVALDDFKSINSSVHISGDEKFDLFYVLKDRENFYNSYMSLFEDKAMELSSYKNLNRDVLSIVFSGEREDLKKLKERIEENFSDKYNVHLYKLHNRKFQMLEILQNTGDKFFGVKKYIANKKIDISEVIAIGDASNDARLLKEVGLGIAMINGSNLAKSQADIITKYDNNNDGAIRELRRILFGWVYEYKLVSWSYEKDHRGHF